MRALYFGQLVYRRYGREDVLRNGENNNGSGRAERVRVHLRAWVYFEYQFERM